MTARQFLPGTTWFITRRCIDGRHFFTPDSPIVAWLFRFLLAWYAGKHGVLLHSYCLMGNHQHLTLTDPHGNVPVFEQELNQMLARLINLMRLRLGTVWEPGVPPNYVELTTLDASIEKTAYTIANAPNAGLVPTHSKWPGAVSSPADCLSPSAVVPLPELTGAFGKRSTFRRLPLPLLELAPDPRAESPEAWAQALTKAVARHEAKALDKAKAHARSTGRGRLFLGALACSRVPWDYTPPVEQLRGVRRIRPMFAGPREVIERCLEARGAFLDRYEAALAAFRAGDRNTIFPAGTFAMVRRYRVNVAPAPS